MLLKVSNIGGSEGSTEHVAPSPVLLEIEDSLYIETTEADLYTMLKNEPDPNGFGTKHEILAQLVHKDKVSHFE